MYSLHNWSSDCSNAQESRGGSNKVFGQRGILCLKNHLDSFGNFFITYQVDFRQCIPLTMAYWDGTVFCWPEKVPTLTDLPSRLRCLCRSVKCLTYSPPSSP